VNRTRLVISPIRMTSTPAPVSTATDPPNTAMLRPHPPHRTATGTANQTGKNTAAIVTPTAAIVNSAALQYIFWANLRLPLGATLTMVCLLFGTWMVRWTNFGGWDYFPINFVWPATLVPGALLLDLVLMRTNSFLITSMLGGFLFGLVFYWGCWPALAPFLQPILYHGHVMSLSDLQGFQYLRTGDHEYMRLIETGNLRAFLQESLYVAMFFSGFTSMFAYWLGIGIGKWLAVYPATKFLQQA
jgi:methane/ammonia monooxygenase subunit A